jgi:hypothetical protein
MRYKRSSQILRHFGMPQFPPFSAEKGLFQHPRHLAQSSQFDIIQGPFLTLLLPHTAQVWIGETAECPRCRLQTTYDYCQGPYQTVRTYDCR